MHPDFEIFRGERLAPRELTAFRMPKELRDQILSIAEDEEDTITGILIEGAARVIVDRNLTSETSDNQSL